jgi:two-component system sensor histidine kinase/response regulator
MARLAGISGISVSRGLSLVHGEVETYLDLLRGFILSRGGDIAQLSASLEGGDYAAAQRLVHNLKGTAATLGAEGLAEQAACLESLLSSDTPEQSVSGALEAVRAELALLVAALTEIVQPQHEHCAGCSGS